MALSDGTRLKMRLAKLGKSLTEEHKRHIGESYCKNRDAGLHQPRQEFHHSEDAKQRIGKASIGRHAGKPNVSSRAVGDLYSETLYLRVQQGLPVFCRIHGEHTDWRVSKRKNTVFCRPCVYVNNWKHESKNYFGNYIDNSLGENCEHLR